MQALLIEREDIRWVKSLRVLSKEVVQKITEEFNKNDTIKNDLTDKFFTVFERDFSIFRFKIKIAFKFSLTEKNTIAAFGNASENPYYPLFYFFFALDPLFKQEIKDKKIENKIDYIVDRIKNGAFYEEKYREIVYHELVHSIEAIYHLVPHHQIEPQTDEEYANLSSEVNAFFLSTLTSYLNSKPETKDFKIFSKNFINNYFVSSGQHLYSLLNQDNKKRIIKRLYDIYKKLNGKNNSKN